MAIVKSHAIAKARARAIIMVWIRGICRCRGIYTAIVRDKFRTMVRVRVKVRDKVCVSFAVKVRILCQG
jgi:hypothetical protein